MNLQKWMTTMNSRSDIFEDVKACLDITEVLNYYGIRTNRKKAVCPFHTEKTASLIIYPHTQSFYCFGCGESGDVISFVSKLFDIKPIEAVKKLNSDFMLGFDIEKPVKRQYISEYKRKEKAERIYEKQESEVFKILALCHRKLHNDIRRYAPKEYTKDLPEEYVYAIDNIGYIEYLLDILQKGTSDEKIKTVKEVRTCCKRYLKKK